MKTVVMAMSGGIDSSISALLLKREGYNVIGVTMAIWDESFVTGQLGEKEHFQSGCFGPSEAEDIETAQTICRELGIEHYVINLQESYKEIVLDYFQERYLAGLTPNPCVMCNKEIKFSLLPLKVKEMGIDYDFYATGHYVRLLREGGFYYIGKGLDTKKDQSYFLCRLQQNQLSKMLFPLGELTKEDIRKIASQEGFVNLIEKKESQDFIDSSDYACLFKEDSAKPGKILDKEGNQIGVHKGIIYYTIGKRRGLNISGLSEPFYVTSIDAKNNIVYAGPKAELYSTRLVAEDVIWADNVQRKDGFRTTAKIRLHHQQSPCLVVPKDNNVYDIIFDNPQLSITPGQIIAFYDVDRVLGGGVIYGMND